MWVVFVDLDSTLCDTTQRHPMIVPGFSDWEAYSLACAEDVPFEATVRLVQILAASRRIVILSARDDAARGLTVQWLKRYGVPWDELLLREREHPAEPVEYKRQRIEEYQVQHPEAKLELLIDDDRGMKALEDLLPVLVVNPCYPSRAERVGKGEVAHAEG